MTKGGHSASPTFKGDVSLGLRSCAKPEAAMVSAMNTSSSLRYTVIRTLGKKCLQVFRSVTSLSMIHVAQSAIEVKRGRIHFYKNVSGPFLLAPFYFAGMMP